MAQTKTQRAPVKYDSKAYNEKAFAAIRKILRVYGFDSVSRRLINFVADSTQRFLRTHYFGG
jgi:hypothetical protein